MVTIEMLRTPAQPSMSLRGIVWRSGDVESWPQLEAPLSPGTCILAWLLLLVLANQSQFLLSKATLKILQTDREKVEELKTFHSPPSAAL